MTVLLCQIDTDRLAIDQDSVDGLLDLASVAVSEYDPSEIWVSIAARNLAGTVTDKLQRVLGIPASHVVRSQRSAGLGDGGVLLCGILSYLREDADVAVYDCNSAGFADDIALPRDNRLSLCSRLTELDEAHRRRQLSECRKIVHKIVDIADRFRSDIGTSVLRAVRPIDGYLDTYGRLLGDLGRSLDDAGATGGLNSLVSLGLSKRIEHLGISASKMHENVRQADFVRRSLSFFRHGLNCMRSLQPGPQRPPRDSVHEYLLWFCGLLLAASREEANNERGNAALLLAFRSLEVFVLAYLWDIRRARIGRYGGFALDGVEDPGFRELWDAFLESAPPEFGDSVRDPVDKLRLSRNRNVLIHGFDRVGEGTIAHARGCVKRVLKHWNPQYRKGAGLDNGPTGVFVEGENWTADLGRRVADAALAQLSVR